MNDHDPSPPPGLSPSEGLRWITAHRNLTAAEHTDINRLDDAERAHQFARLRTTAKDLLGLCAELSKRCGEAPDGPSGML